MALHSVPGAPRRNPVPAVSADEWRAALPERIDEQRYRLHQVKGICSMLNRVFADVTEYGLTVDEKLAFSAEVTLEAAIALLEDIDEELGKVRS
jgi:hypothetical protein